MRIGKDEVGRAALMSAPRRECTPLSIPMAGFCLVLFPVCVAQPGAVAALGRVGVYILGVFWCFGALSLSARGGLIHFCLTGGGW
jgi:hypothetical protein